MSKRKRGFSQQVLDSGIVQALALDAMLMLALTCIGVTVYKLAPDLMWAYIGIVLMLGWWVVTKAKAAEKPRT